MTDAPADHPDEEPVVLPIEDALDLHAFHPRDVTSVVDEYLVEASRRGFGEVRLIHGRGKGVQRAAVQSLLARHPLVQRYFDAPPERGGWGATVVVLTLAAESNGEKRASPERRP
jgi:DNA-nicking Smr family endonuclease